MDRVLDLTPSLTLRIAQRADLGLGGSVWDAALLLSHALTTPQLQQLLPLPHPLSSSSSLSSSPWRGQIVCELGCGTGVCGLSAAVLGASFVVLTDLPHWLPLIRRNIEGNPLSPHSRASAFAYTWGDSTAALKAHVAAEVSSCVPLFPFTVILVSDCVYDQAGYEPLIDSLDELVGPDTLLLISYEKRRARELVFWRSLHRRFEFERLPPEWMEERWRCDEVAVLRVRRRREVRRVEVENDAELGEFFQSFPHDLRYQ